MHCTCSVVHAVVTHASSSLIVLIWLLISCHIIMAAEGVAMTLAWPAVHRLELVTWPEWLVIIERCTMLALLKTITYWAWMQTLPTYLSTVYTKCSWPDELLNSWNGWELTQIQNWRRIKELRVITFDTSRHLQYTSDGMLKHQKIY